MFISRNFSRNVITEHKCTSKETDSLLLLWKLDQTKEKRETSVNRLHNKAGNGKCQLLFYQIGLNFLTVWNAN